MALNLRPSKVTLTLSERMELSENCLVFAKELTVYVTAHVSLFGRQKKYRELLSALRAYFLEMEIPAGVIEAMLGVSSSERIARIPDNLAYDLRAAPSVSEWIAASCGALTRREWVINTLSRPPSLFSEDIVREIQRKAANIAKCSWKKRVAYRQTIVTP